MNTYCILGDYVAADFLPAPESRIVERQPFSDIVKIVLEGEGSPEADQSRIRSVLEPILTKDADFLLIDLQDARMLTQPEADQPDPLSCSRDRWKTVIDAVMREILASYMSSQLIVNEHYSSTIYLEDGTFHSYGDKNRISRCNMLMRFLFAEIENAAQGCHIIPFPADVFDVSILWDGEKEYQYHPRYYRYGQKAMRAILNQYENADASAEGREEEETRIAIEHERCSELMTWMSDSPALAAEEDHAERRRVRDLRAEVTGSDWLLLAWTENIYASSYLIKRYINGVWEQIDSIDAATQPCCRIGNLEPGKVYYFHVGIDEEDGSCRYGQDIVCRTNQSDDRNDY